MDFLKNFNWREPRNILKIALVAFVGIILLTLVIRLLGPSLLMLSHVGGLNRGVTSVPAYDYDTALQYGGYDGYEKGISSFGAGSPDLSYRNSAPILPRGGATGNTAEEFEVTEYSAGIETGDIEKTCGVITDLKSRAYVIFENANSYDRGCSFTFKVEHARAEEILAFIQGLEPKDLSESTYTIKQLVDDFTAEEEVLRKKQATIESTLESAIDAYDDITALATRAEDVETLAKIINSKIQTIERLTQERIAVNEQLDRLARAKAEQLDRIEYTYFHVTVTENKYINGKDLKESWKTALRQFVRDVNKVFQDVTINLVGLLLIVFQYVLYFFILLVVVKYGWRLTTHIWKK